MISIESLPSSAAELAAQRGAAIHVTDPDSEIGEWLSKGRAAAAILRPDRTVMLAGTDVSRLCAALPALR